MSKKYLNGVLVDMSSSEIQEYNERNTAWDNGIVDRKLIEIKQIRLEKLEETDFWVLRGNITTAQSNYRQALRDIPSTYNESDYDSLLARNENGEVTHSVWSKP
jgi:hypothetical protein